MASEEAPKSQFTLSVLTSSATSALPGDLCQLPHEYLVFSHLYTLVQVNLPLEVTHPAFLFHWKIFFCKDPFKSHCYYSYLPKIHSTSLQLLLSLTFYCLLFIFQSLNCVCLFSTPWTEAHTRLPCPSLSPRVCSNSCPLSQWCYLTFSSAATPFSSCLYLIFPRIRVFSNESALSIIR